MKNRCLFFIALLIFFPPRGGRCEGADAMLPRFQEDVNAAIAGARASVVRVSARKPSAGGKAPMWYESIGTGFVVDKRGYILTNHHVVNGADGISVRLWGARPETLDAEVVHGDEKQDLVLLKILAKAPLVPVVFGNSEGVEAGDWTLTLGNPFGFNHSASLGIVGACSRNLDIQGRAYLDMIQTDAVINEGNSGGPLLDIRGRVVGVSTAIYAPDGTYTGLGFAIPINRAIHFFTHITGPVVTAAATAPPGAPVKKSRITMMDKMPKDATHRKFSDCTRCHSITLKSPVAVTEKMPHPPAGACDKCHILESRPGAGAPVTVSFVSPLADGAGSGFSYFWEIFRHTFLKCVPLILVASIVFSMLGLGGGFFYVPILLGCGTDFHTASTTSLLMLTAASASSFFIFLRSGYVDFRLVSALVVPAMAGAYYGGVFSAGLNSSALYLLFTLTLFIAAYFMVSEPSLDEVEESPPGSGSLKWRRVLGEYSYDIDLLLALSLSLLVGFMGGVLGIAGGWVIVPMLVVLFAVPMRVAVATSSLMVPFTGIAGFFGHRAVGDFDPHLAVPLAIVAVIGAQIGSRITLHTETAVLRVIFAFVLGLTGFWMLWRVL